MIMIFIFAGGRKASGMLDKAVLPGHYFNLAAYFMRGMKERNEIT